MGHGYYSDSNNKEENKLLLGDDLKRKISKNIETSTRRASYIIPVFGGIFVLAGIICLILSFTLVPLRPNSDRNYHQNSSHTLLLIIGAVFTGSALIWGCMSWCFCVAMKARTLLGNSMFDEGTHIYHYVFEDGEKWRAFAEHKWNLKSKIMIFAYVVSFMLIVIGAIPFGITISSVGPALAFGITWAPFIGFALLLFVLILSISQYQRFRKFKPEVHCLVLSRGAFYTLGNMRAIQHSTAHPSQMMVNLTRVKLSRKRIEPFDLAIIDIVGFTVNHKGHRIPVETECPVPEDCVAPLIQWIPEFATPFNDEQSRLLAKIPPAIEVSVIPPQFDAHPFVRP